ncbi:hypothetical protein [Sphingobium sp. LB126]|uniref:hypothetical protein n=1 Tax=Sphingobium sp. LB126 TaxID=1983755 RepID=UPI001A8D5B5B|nr:hypothetical protein [Sphingobium sp. LB126]
MGKAINQLCFDMTLNHPCNIQSLIEICKDDAKLRSRRFGALKGKIAIDKSFDETFLNEELGGWDLA